METARVGIALDIRRDGAGAVVQSPWLQRAIPGIGAIAALLALSFSVAAVMATKLFGGVFPEGFGPVGASPYSLFQIMTLESWSMGIVRPVVDVYPYAWAFRVPFILIATLTVLGLFVAVIVGAMQSAHETFGTGQDGSALGERDVIPNEIRDLRRIVEWGIPAMRRMEPSGAAAVVSAREGLRNG